MRRRGETAFPAPAILPEGLEVKVPSRESERDIPCRVLFPSKWKSGSERRGVKGVMCHFHGGGWTVSFISSLYSLCDLTQIRFESVLARQC